MSKALEDYALISDCRRAALVHLDGSIDWLCVPRFDSPACFSALLGDKSHGCWQIAPSSAYQSTHRYRKNSLVLETHFVSDEGEILLTDLLVTDQELPLLIRCVTGIKGKVKMNMQVNLRFDYGSIVPWIRVTEYGIHAIAGPDDVHIESPAPLTLHDDLRCSADFSVSEGENLWFSFQWNSQFEPKLADRHNLNSHLRQTDEFWQEYASQCVYEGRYQEMVVRSVLLLKALTYLPTGAIIAAPTTSLPESLGGERNWDYRYCWIRDATFSMYALLTAGYKSEAQKWISWLTRALAGTPSQANIMYGLAGERRLPEIQLDWLPGYEESRPVRVGNAAYKQLQLDVFGEALDTFYLALKHGLTIDENCWRIQACFIDFLENHWQEPDEGIWEVRGPRQHFTHSKVMAWVAVDRAIRSAQLAKMDAPLLKWQRLRKEIHDEVCRRGFNKKLNSFTQTYDSEAMDASLLMLPAVGFLPADDPRVVGTVAAVEKHLFKDGLVLRYKTDEIHDVLKDPEGSFLACSFWLVDCWVLMGQIERAEDLFCRLVAKANSVKLFSEEYDAKEKRMIGNFPQALSHIALINSAFNLHNHRCPALDRSQCLA